MTLPVDVGRRPAEVGAVAGLMLGVGYTIGAIAPLLLGAARDVTGTFTTTLWLIAASGAFASPRYWLAFLLVPACTWLLPAIEPPNRTALHGAS